MKRNAKQKSKLENQFPLLVVTQRIVLFTKLSSLQSFVFSI